MFYRLLPQIVSIVESKPEIQDKFEGVNAVIQVSYFRNGVKEGLHYFIRNGTWRVFKGVIMAPTIEVEFCSLAGFTCFVKGKLRRIPKISGLCTLGLLVEFVKLVFQIRKEANINSWRENDIQNIL